MSKSLEVETQVGLLNNYGYHIQMVNLKGKDYVYSNRHNDYNRYGH